MIKKIIIIALSILLPILGGFLVITYALNVRYLPDVNTEVSSDFMRDLNKGVITCEGRIKNYRMVENYYYSSEPLLKREYENSNGEHIFTIEIYRNLCAYQPSAQVEKTWKCLFEVFLYDIDYELVKEYFYLDDMKELDGAGNPTFTIKFSPTNGRDPFTLTLSNRSNVMIPDYNSNPQYENEATKTRNYLQSAIIREYETTATFDTFSNDANIELSAYYTIINDDNSTTEVNPQNSYIIRDYISDFRHKGEQFEFSDFLPGFRQPSVKDTYKNAGYYKWLFAHYLWWEFIIGFVLVGALVAVFDVIYFDKKSKQINKAKKIRRL